MIESGQDFPKVLLELYEIISQARLIKLVRFKTGYYHKPVTV